MSADFGVGFWQDFTSHWVRDVTARVAYLKELREKISQIIGPVVDIAASPGSASVEVTVSQAIQVQGVTCEVQQLLGEGTIR